MTAEWALTRLREHRAAQDKLTGERDRLILDAKDAGAPVTHIANAIGLDRTQIHRIIRENGEVE